MAGAQHSPDLASLRYFIPSGQIRRFRPPSLTRDPSPVPRVSGGRRLRRRRDTGDLGWSNPSPTTASRASTIPAAAASSVTALWRCSEENGLSRGSAPSASSSAVGSGSGRSQAEGDGADLVETAIPCSMAGWKYVELVSCMNLCCWGHLACCALRGFHVGGELHAEQDLHSGRRHFHNLKKKEVRKEEKEQNKGKGAHCQGHREMNHNHLTQAMDQDQGQRRDKIIDEIRRRLAPWTRRTTEPPRPSRRP